MATAMKKPKRRLFGKTKYEPTQAQKDRHKRNMELLGAIRVRYQSEKYPLCARCMKPWTTNSNCPSCNPLCELAHPDHPQYAENQEPTPGLRSLKDLGIEDELQSIVDFQHHCFPPREDDETPPAQKPEPDQSKGTFLDWKRSVQNAGYISLHRRRMIEMRARSQGVEIANSLWVEGEELRHLWLQFSFSGREGEEDLKRLRKLLGIPRRIPLPPPAVPADKLRDEPAVYDGEVIRAWATANATRQLPE